MGTLMLSPPIVDLDVTAGSDWSFDIQWWEQDEVTPINVTSFEGRLMTDYTQDAKELLDFADHGSVVDNVICIRVPALVSGDIEPGEFVWYINAVSTEGEDKALIRGRVIVRLI